MSRKSLRNVMRLISEETQDIPAEQQFLADLKRSIELTANSNTKIPSKTYKPSSMSCIRSMYYQVTGTQPDKNDSSYTLVGICNSGTDIHVRIQTAVAEMKNNGIDCEYIDVGEFVKNRNIPDLEIIEKSGMETKFWNKKLNMHFLCDGVIRYKGKYYILELKTETSYKWQTRMSVNEAHYDQATAYSVSLNLDNVLFVYISRDTLDMKAFMLTVTSDMKQDLIGKIEECNDYVSKGEVPPRPEEVKCTYCAYKGACWKNG